MISMRASRVLRKMRDGQVAVCVALKIADAFVSEIAGQAGFDCIWIDTEHTATTLREIENHIRAAKLYDTDLIVRVQRGSYSDLIHSLEMDATGIMVPHLMSAAEARDIARKTKFHPIGRRALDGGNADGAFCQIPVDAYLEQANSERFIIVQIEDPEPLVEIDEIAQVEGIDMLFFGPGDFSHGIGVPGKFDDPRVIEARERVVEAARKHGKWAGTVGSPANFEALANMGYQFINIGADVIGLVEYFKGLRRALGREA
jgi:4-hydroxy-2-oxoheptanedioate aldolase